jgi:hypothetical protein
MIGYYYRPRRASSKETFQTTASAMVMWIRIIWCPPKQEHVAGTIVDKLVAMNADGWYLR